MEAQARSEHDERGQDERKQMLSAMTEAARDEVVQRREEVSSHLERDHGRGRDSRQHEVAPQSALFPGCLRFERLVIAKPYGTGLVTRFRDRMLDIRLADAFASDLYMRALGREVDSSGPDASYAEQRLLDMTDTSRAVHALDGVVAGNRRRARRRRGPEATLGNLFHAERNGPSNHGKVKAYSSKTLVLGVG